MTRARPRRRRTTAIDAGWLYLVSGLTLMAAGVLIPVQHDLGRALWRRDRVLSAEMHRLQRLTRHELYLDAIDRRDETVLRQLAARQLGLAPADTEIILLSGDATDADASVFDSLEPEPITLPAGPEVASLLGHWATGQHTRLWLLSAASLLVLIGLLPPGDGERGTAEDDQGDE